MARQRDDRWRSEKLRKWFDAQGKQFGVARLYLDFSPAHLAPIVGRERSARSIQRAGDREVPERLEDADAVSSRCRAAGQIIVRSFDRSGRPDQRPVGRTRDQGKR